MKADRLYLFFAACYLAQGMSGVIYEPVAYLLKDHLGLSPAQSAGFIWLMTLPLLLKPLFGLLSDLVTVRGRRRLPHMIAACLLWTGALAALALADGLGYRRLLALLLLVNVGLVGADVVCDAVMVEQGRLHGKTGPYQAAQIGILYATIVATGVGGGWLAAHASAKTTFALAAAFPLLTLASVPWLRESAADARPAASLRPLSRLLLSRRFWAVAALIFLWSFAPFLGTAQFYYQVDALKLSPVAIGWLGTLGGLSGALGAVAYGRLIGRWPLTLWLRAAVIAGAPLAGLYLLYVGPLSAAAVTIAIGFVGVGFRLALMDLAARSCPEGAEAVSFAAYMAVFNVAASGSNMAGGWLLGTLRERVTPYGCLAVLTLISVACTAACWPLLPAVCEGLEKAPA